MNRHLMHKLRDWQGSKGRKPLILKGVRQVGKTYLLQQFGQKYFPNYHIINFEKQRDARGIFEENLDPKQIINKLQFFLDDHININQDLVVFDEIQACPNALTSLKYFCEEMPDLALCAAGSLLGLHFNEGSYPVGKVDMMHLYSMTFREFILGIGDDLAVETVENIKVSSKTSDIAHQHLWKRLKEYFVTGGLPEVVAIFSEQQNSTYRAYQVVRKKQEELISAYYADMAKHSGKVNAMHLDRTWRSVPTQLASAHDGSINRFKFKDVIPGITRYKQLVDTIDWLEAAELVIKVPLVETIRHPLHAFTKDNRFKLNMFDIGILGAISGLDPRTILEYDYGTYKGYFAENYVAQQLTASSNQMLHSWQENRSEVEFIIQNKGKIIPIEVKAGNIIRAKSLQKYIDKYHPTKSIILSANKISVDHNKRLYHIPLYLADNLVDLCA